MFVFFVQAGIFFISFSEHKTTGCVLFFEHSSVNMFKIRFFTGINNVLVMILNAESWLSNVILMSKDLVLYATYNNKFCSSQFDKRK